MCGPEDPPLHASPVVRKDPISSKRVSSQDLLLRKFGIFTQILAHKPQIWKFFSSQAPKFGNFQFTSPLFRGKYQFASPCTSEIRAAHPYLKKKKS